MLDIEEIREKLKDRNLAYVGRKLNMTRSYLQAIRSGRFNPPEETQRRISEYLEG